MIKSGAITVATAGTAVQGPSVPVAGNTASAKKLAFYLKADPANTDVVYFGNDGADDVTADNGYPLSVGEAVFIEVNSLDELWFDAAVSGEKIRWVLASL